jgi:leucine dehydrogenase
VINGGGVINVYGELLKWDLDRAKRKAAQIYDTLLTIYEIAKRQGIPSYRAADQMAEQRIGAVAGLRKL